jgi:AcrR family transcriptional regulator
MPDTVKAPSMRRAELLEAAYGYVLANGFADMSLRPLAAAIGSSPRVLLFLFGSKEGLVRALLARARTDEMALVEDLRATTATSGLAGPRAVAAAIWQWLADADHRAVLILWTEAYARSLTDPRGPWADFARSTVDDWLEVLATAPGAGRERATLTLAVLRGALLDLLATGDLDRTTHAVLDYVEGLPQ